MIKQVTEIPQEIVDRFEEGFNKIDEMYDVLKEQGSIKTPEHYTVKEFMKKGKMSRNKYEQIKDQLDAVRVSPRKIMIPHSDLVRWFRGDFN